VPVFLPGFKKDRQVEVPVAPARSTEGIVWHTVLHYPSLSERYPSTASALVSLDHHLLRIAFDFTRCTALGAARLFSRIVIDRPWRLPVAGVDR
jgi:hypothetical protein